MLAKGCVVNTYCRDDAPNVSGGTAALKVECVEDWPTDALERTTTCTVLAAAGISKLIMGRCLIEQR